MHRRVVAVLVAGALGLASCTSTPDESSTPTLGVTITRTVTPSSPARAAPRTVTVIGSGDVLIHPPVWEQAAADARSEGQTSYDFGPIYASGAPVTPAADLGSCE